MTTTLISTNSIPIPTRPLILSAGPLIDVFIVRLVILLHQVVSIPPSSLIQFPAAPHHQ